VGQSSRGGLLRHRLPDRGFAAGQRRDMLRVVGPTAPAATEPVTEIRPEQHQRREQQEQQVRRAAGHRDKHRAEHEGDGEGHEREALAVHRPALGRQGHPHRPGRDDMSWRPVEQQV
jgi:hypothetical protein